MHDCSFVYKTNLYIRLMLWTKSVLIVYTISFIGPFAYPFMHPIHISFKQPLIISPIHSSILYKHKCNFNSNLV